MGKSVIAFKVIVAPWFHLGFYWRIWNKVDKQTTPSPFPGGQTSRHSLPLHRDSITMVIERNIKYYRNTIHCSDTLKTAAKYKAFSKVHM